MKFFFSILLMFILSYSTDGKTMTKEIDYTIGNSTFKGFLAWDDHHPGKRPGILLVHEWWGLNDFIKGKAHDFAELGYVVFAADMYGDGKSTSDPQIAATMAGEVRGTPRMRERVTAGLRTLLKQKDVDPQRIAGIGYCFGGTSVLELAYSGARVNGVITFHAGIASPKPGDLAAIKARFLILHGADDPYASPDSVARMQESLRKAGVDWQMVYFGNAVHGFTNPANGSDNGKGLAYNPLAARRSWEYAKMFLTEIFNGDSDVGR
jgi:dienelactone hydrolase